MDMSARALMVTAATLSVVALNLQGQSSIDQGSNDHEHSHDHSHADSQGLRLPTDEVSYVEADYDVFESLEELAAASSLVVRAEAVGTEPGREMLVDPVIETVLEHEVVTLEVTEVLAGSESEPDREVTIEQERFYDGRTVVTNDMYPIEVGEQGIYFLWQWPDLDHYVLRNHQSRYVEDGSGEAAELMGSDPHDPLVQETSSLTLDEIAERVTASE